MRISFLNAFRLAALASGLILGMTVVAQGILFDLDDAPVHSPLPLDLTKGGVTAHFSATGQGFSIQPANTMGFTPAGFGGNCLYPSSVFAADLIIGFSQAVTHFSILYAPQELGCDDSATLQVTAFLDAALVGSSTATAGSPGTWPSEQLQFQSAQRFNSVVVHYRARPPTCQDWGPIFMADNMTIELAPPPLTLTNPVRLPGGSFQFEFVFNSGQRCSVFASHDPVLPLSSWTMVGVATETSPGQYRFIDSQASASAQQFYRVRSP